MTQEYTPSIEMIMDVYASARANAMQIQLSDEWNREHKRIVKQAMGTFAAHDAQIRAEALTLTDEETNKLSEVLWNYVEDEDLEAATDEVNGALETIAKTRMEQKQ